MMPTEQSTPSQSDSLSMEFDLPHTREKVWRALTDPVLLAEWLLPVVGFTLESGATFTFTAPSQPAWDGTVHCRLLEMEIGTRLSYTWTVGELDTVVAFTLTPTASGTRLSVVHSGFTAAQKRNRSGARYGWKVMGGKLVDLLSRME